MELEIFSTYFLKILESKKIHKNPSSGAELFHAERRTDRQT